MPHLILVALPLLGLQHWGLYLKAIIFWLYSLGSPPEGPCPGLPGGPVLAITSDEHSDLPLGVLSLLPLSQLVLAVLGFLDMIQLLNETSFIFLEKTACSELGDFLFVEPNTDLAYLEWVLATC